MLRRSKAQSETSTKTLVLSLVIRSADVGTINRDTEGATKVASANMLGLRILSGLSNAMRTLLRLVSDSTTSLTNRTLPVKTSSGYERKVTLTVCPVKTNEMSFSGTFAVTQMVSRLAIVIIAAVASLRNAPGATCRSMMLPDTAAFTDRSRDCSF